MHESMVHTVHTKTQRQESKRQSNNTEQIKAGRQCIVYVLYGARDDYGPEHQTNKAGVDRKNDWILEILILEDKGQTLKLIARSMKEKNYL